MLAKGLGTQEVCIFTNFMDIQNVENLLNCNIFKYYLLTYQGSEKFKKIRITDFNTNAFLNKQKY